MPAAHSFKSFRPSLDSSSVDVEGEKGENMVGVGQEVESLITPYKRPRPVSAVHHRRSTPASPRPSPPDELFDAAVAVKRRPTSSDLVEDLRLQNARLREDLRKEKTKRLRAEGVAIQAQMKMKKMQVEVEKEKLSPSELGMLQQSLDELSAAFEKITRRVEDLEGEPRDGEEPSEGSSSGGKKGSRKGRSRRRDEDADLYLTSSTKDDHRDLNGIPSSAWSEADVVARKGGRGSVEDAKLPPNYSLIQPTEPVVVTPPSTSKGPHSHHRRRHERAMMSPSTDAEVADARKRIEEIALAEGSAVRVE
uniref:Uncharacterized protein n=1 Tax=Palpitomonas bilix TaxID=652834 RepID=A0A7S3D6K9_9EUKA|mmetsp:Transcript_24312/g.61344  ORF Transcript_24312/g.61344 Transcript_24312/m.61344 type:complete len:307 (+) Transcript_24312:740-1660(+)